MNNFTVLDYQVAVGHIPGDDMSGVGTSNYDVDRGTSTEETAADINLEALSEEIVWKVGKTRSVSKPGVSELVSCVLVDDLAPASFYVIRVKVKTIAGWSPWSITSDPFRTLSVQ